MLFPRSCECERTNRRFHGGELRLGLLQQLHVDLVLKVGRGNRNSSGKCQHGPRFDHVASQGFLANNPGQLRASVHRIGNGLHSCHAVEVRVENRDNMHMPGHFPDGVIDDCLAESHLLDTVSQVVRWCARGQSNDIDPTNLSERAKVKLGDETGPDEAVAKSFHVVIQGLVERVRFEIEVHWLRPRTG